ncbi:MAG: DUF3299 domain-containing protein [Bacteroidetes bacterium]|nr:DUF3299 domain-containing protein [Bacteroidota bacterium]
MVRRVFFLIMMLWCLEGLSAQQNAWSLLMLTETEKQFDPTLGMEIDVPNIHPAAKKLDGEQVQLEGFIIPLKGKKDQSHFMFSAFPINMCYFCGRAGPESVIEVFMKDGNTLPFTEKKIWLQGTLRINEKDPQSNLYTLNYAKKI